MAEQHTHDLAAETRMRERDRTLLMKTVREMQAPTTAEEDQRRFEMLMDYEDRAMEAGSRYSKVIRVLHRHATARVR